LSLYGRDLTLEARAGRLTPVVGREREVSHVLRVLMKREKSNPVLVGPPGVGKTAIVEGVAQRMAQGLPGMEAMRVVALDVGGLVAGTQYRGSFEDRVQGGMRFIGATTPEEWAQHVEQDAAFARRLQRVAVHEPTPAEATAWLTRLAGVYEAHHGVAIHLDVPAAAVETARRYLTSRYLPDSAIDVLDEACARVRIQEVQATPGAVAMGPSVGATEQHVQPPSAMHTQGSIPCPVPDARPPHGREARVGVAELPRPCPHCAFPVPSTPSSLITCPRRGG